MKKILLLFLAAIMSVMMCACSGGENNAASITITDIEQAFQQEDPEFTWNEDKPLYPMIYAKDGWMGYVNGKIVKVYEYPDEKTYQKAVKDHAFLEECPKNGNFVLETSSEDVETLFSSLPLSPASNAESSEAK